MYCIVTYDVQQEKVNKVCNFLRRYLNWVQNSVFEGEISEFNLIEITNFLESFIDKSVDSVLFYKVRTKDEVNKYVLGVEKADISRIL